jgi:hypothetical protein
MDFTYFDDADYFDDDMKSRTVDPATLDFPLKSGRFVGRDELYACITTPRHKRIEGRCQHHMDGQPAMFRLVDDETAVIVSDSTSTRGREGTSPRPCNTKTTPSTAGRSGGSTADGASPRTSADRWGATEPANSCPASRPSPASPHAATTHGWGGGF